MTAAKTQKLERLDALESKISQAAEIIAELNTRCKALGEEQQRLQQKLADLTNRNKNLAQQIDELESKNQVGSAKALSEKKILSRIDRMIEKFGELQV
ncbi:MAG: SlyX family protein [Candidatus Krumholzibacteria bacterium]|nr:SlyX family protein [Candidatus Krumholzibacteria bacterium]